MENNSMNGNALDKMIDIAERNLAMQGEFLKGLMELKGRFDIADRDHHDLDEIAKTIAANSFDILNMMKAASNEKIINMMEDDRQRATTLYNEFSVMCSKIADIAGADKWMKALISIITAILIVVQSIGLYILSGKDTDIETLQSCVTAIKNKLDERGKPKNILDKEGQE